MNLKSIVGSILKSNQINNGIAKLGEYKQNNELSILILQDMISSSSKHNKTQDTQDTQDTQVDTEKLFNKSNYLNSAEQSNNNTYASTSNDILYNTPLTEQEKKALFNLEFEVDKLKLQKAVSNGDKEGVTSILNRYNSSVYHKAIGTINNELNGAAIGRVVKDKATGDYTFKSYIKNLSEMININAELYNKSALNLKKLIDFKLQSILDHRQNLFDNVYLPKLENQREYYYRTGYAFETIARHDNIQESIPEEVLNTFTTFKSTALPVSSLSLSSKVSSLFNFDKDYKVQDHRQFIVSEENNDFECLANKYHIEYTEM